MLRRRPAGFTLLEIMLVLVVLALGAVAVIPNLSGNPHDEAKAESGRFYQLVQLWSEQALLSGRTLGVRVNKKDYRLFMLDGDDWAPMTKGKYADDVQLPEGLSMELDVSGFSWDESDQLFERGSLFDDELFAEEEDKPEPPQLVLMANGEIIPFTLTFIADKKRLWRITGNEVAMFEWQAIDKETR